MTKQTTIVVTGALRVKACSVSCLFLFRMFQLALTLSTLGKIFSRLLTEIFYLIFSQKTDFDISCKLSPIETICTKCQILFSGKNKKNITNLSSAELAKRVVKVNEAAR